MHVACRTGYFKQHPNYCSSPIRKLKHLLTEEWLISSASLWLKGFRMCHLNNCSAKDL